MRAVVFSNNSFICDSRRNKRRFSSDTDPTRCSWPTSTPFDSTFLICTRNKSLSPPSTSKSMTDLVAVPYVINVSSLITTNELLTTHFVRGITGTGYLPSSVILLFLQPTTCAYNEKFIFSISRITITTTTRPTGTETGDWTGHRNTRPIHWTLDSFVGFFKF